MKLHQVLLAILLLCLVPRAFGQAAPINPEVAPGYIPGLAPGDQLEVNFVDFTEAAVLHLTISPAGTIFVPYAGPVHVAGLSPDQAQQAIVDALKTKNIVNDPQVALNVISARNLSVLVLGEVKLPQRYPLFSEAPLSTVISLAGGFTNNANMHVLITHPDGSLPTDVNVSRDLHDLHTLNATVAPGDLVAVVPAGSFFAVGELNHPGVYPIVGTQHMTLLQALAIAGGPTLNAGLSRARVLRTVDGRREEIMIDLAKLEHGTVADPFVHTDDILYVPRNGLKPILNNWFNTAIAIAGLSLALSRF